MLPPGAEECRKTQAAGRDRGIRHPSVFRPMPLWADTMIVHQWYAVSRRVGIPQARKEPEQTFESVRTTGLLSTVAARKKKTEIFYNRKKRNKETSYF